MQVWSRTATCRFISWLLWL